MKPLRGTRGKFNLRQLAAVRVENIHRAQLVQIAPGRASQAVLKIPRRKVDILRSDEGADSRAIVSLLDLVPPALALVLDHRRLFDKDPCRWAEQVKQSLIRASYRSKELPARKDRG